MDTRNTILNELLGLSPVLAQSNPVNPYRLPQGYFDQLPEAILSRVKGEEVSPVLGSAKPNPYTIPAGYFENLADSILNKVKATELLTDKQNPYTVPAGYFENLADTVLNKIKTAEAGSPKEELELISSVLGKIDKQAPYSLPAGYFDELATNITEGAKAIDLVNNELENLSPLMSSLKKINVYEVPNAYFEEMPSIVLAKAKQQKQAKVISMNFGRKLMRYAAAAVVTGLIVMAGWFYNNKNSLSIKDISDTELQNYVSTQNPVIDDNSDEINYELDAADVKEMLADISDDELQQYVEGSAGNENATTN